MLGEFGDEPNRWANVRSPRNYVGRWAYSVGPDPGSDAHSVVSCRYLIGERATSDLSKSVGLRPSKPARGSPYQENVADAKVAPVEVTSRAPPSWPTSTRMVLANWPVPLRTSKAPVNTVEPFIEWSRHVTRPS